MSGRTQRRPVSKHKKSSSKHSDGIFLPPSGFVDTQHTAVLGFYVHCTIPLQTLGTFTES